MNRVGRMKKLKKHKPLKMIGWREWVALPELGIEKIKVKVDTGARTSALHAFALRPYREGSIQKISFDIHPLQHNTRLVKRCVANVIDKRWVTDSGGHREERYVIMTPVIIGGKKWSIEVTLTERDTMLFRMLLGRSAIRNDFIVTPGKSFLADKRKVIYEHSNTIKKK